jgi:hypothetical protein
MKYEIEDGIPAPVCRGAKDTMTAVIRMLEPGQSVVIPTFPSYLGSLYKKLQPRKYVARALEGKSCRVWRLE